MSRCAPDTRVSPSQQAHPLPSALPPSNPMWQMQIAVRRRSGTEAASGQHSRHAGALALELWGLGSAWLVRFSQNSERLSRPLANCAACLVRYHACPVAMGPCLPFKVRSTKSWLLFSAGREAVCGGWTTARMSCVLVLLLTSARCRAPRFPQAVSMSCLNWI